MMIDSRFYLMMQNSIVKAKMRVLQKYQEDIPIKMRKYHEDGLAAVQDHVEDRLKIPGLIKKQIVASVVKCARRIIS